ncbi:hypothetical protein GCM10023074_13910 [Microbispora amethystogenes]|uniref:Transposase n=1 Tax=Microbispora amethystogenes TaxID=1427754 RepID=A0ABQ4F7T3_9ACTN|nr:hypothetical protein Mam01_10480 [Microbispora amethystogenes]
MSTWTVSAWADIDGMTIAAVPARPRAKAAMVLGRPALHRFTTYSDQRSAPWRAYSKRELDLRGTEVVKGVVMAMVSEL